MKNRRKLSTIKKIILPLSIGIILAVVPFIYLQTKKAPEVKAGWFDENWLYRKSVPITYTGTETLTEYQVLLDSLDTSSLINSKQLQADCDDLRFTSAAGKQLPYFIVGATCNTTDTEIFVKTDIIPAENITIYMYYGNPQAATGQDEVATFSYSSEKTVGYLLGDQDTGADWSGNLRLLSLYAGNSVTHNSTTVSLGFNVEDTTSISANDYTAVSAKGLVSITDGDQSEIPTPVSWAGTEFTGTTTTTSTDTFYIMSPWEDAEVDLYLNGVVQGSCGETLPYTISAGTGVELSCNLTDSQVFRLVSSEDLSGDNKVPILVFYAAERSGNSDRQARPMYPNQDSTGTALFGYPSSSGDISVGNASTNYEYIEDSSTSATTGTISANGQLTITDGGGNFGSTTGPYKIRSTTSGGLLSVLQRNDGNGTDATSWVSNREFGTIMGMQPDTDYIAPVSDQNATCKTYNSSGTLQHTETLTSSNGQVFGLDGDDFGTGGSGTYIASSWYVQCDKPIYSFWQLAAQDSEKHTVTWPMMRQFTYPTPAVGSLGSEEKTTGPAGFWKFDEGSDNTCQGSLADTCDTTNVRNDGVNINATWQTSDKCVSGRCLYFNGTNAAVKVYKNTADLIARWKFDETTGIYARDESGNKNDLTLSAASWLTSGKWNGGWDGDAAKWLSRVDDNDFDFTTSDSFTISGWFKRSATSTQEYIVSKEEATGSDGGYRVSMESDGDISCGVDTNNTSFPLDSATSTAATYDDGNWHHFACVKNGSTSLTLYIDGVSVNTDASLTGSGTYANDDPLYIGDYDGVDNGNEFAGDLDEIRFYSTDLSASEILSEYYTALAHSQYLDFEVNLIPAYTIETWFKANSDGENDLGEIYNKGTNTYARVTNEGSDNLADLEVKADLGTDATFTLTDGVVLNKWHHLAVTYKNGLDGEIAVFLDGKSVGTSTNGVSPMATPDDNDLTIGDGNNNFHGYIDEFKIYGYERTDNEIKADYLKNSSKAGSSVSTGYKEQDFLNQNLAGHWKFDESSGNASDSSGNSTTLTNVSSTAYVSGKFDNSIDPDGSADHFYAADNSDLSITGPITLSAWVNPDTVSGTQFIAGKWDGANESYSLSLNGSAVRMSIDSAANYVETASSTISTGTYQHVVGIYDNRTQTVKIYVNGNLISTTVTGTIPASIADDGGRFSVGAEDASGTPASYFNGKIDDLRLYSRILSSNEVNDLYNWSPSTTSFSAKPLLTARWKFDENTGTTAYDSTSNANNLTLTSASWLTSGKFGSGWDGTGSLWLTRTADSDFNFTTSDSFTFSGWFKRGNSGQEYILARTDATAGSYRVSMEADGSIRCGVDTDSSGFPLDSVTSTSGYEDSNWHHFACVKNGTSLMQLYIDGSLVSSDTSLTASGTYADDSTLYVGDYEGSDNGNEFTGDLDEIHIYRSALSASQVRSDYNALASTTVGITGSTEQSQFVSGDPGTANLRGYWPMNENTGTTITDYSNNNNPLSNTDLGWTNGKLGPAISFNGTSTYLHRVDGVSGDVFDFAGADNFSISAWVKYNGTVSANSYIVTKALDTLAGGYRLYMDASGDFCFDIDDDSAWGPEDSACTSNLDFDDNRWHHVTAVKQGTTALYLYVDGYLAATDATLTATGTLANGVTLSVGAAFAISPSVFGYWNGNIDDVRIYAQQLTNDQIAYLANRGKPHAWWKLDECVGTTAYDSGPFSMNGTITPGASGTTSAGDCVTSATSSWYNGVNGKFNSGLDFDGTDDYVTVADASTFDTNLTEALDFPASGDFTISGWFNRDTSTTDDVILAKRNGIAAGDTGYIVYLDSTNDRVILEVSDGTDEYSITSTSSFTSTGWNHFAFVWDDSTEANIELYVNGKEDTTANKSGTLANIGSLSNSVTFRLGSESDGANYFDGKLDDIKIFLYPLTASQVKSIYTNSSVDF